MRPSIGTLGNTAAVFRAPPPPPPPPPRPSVLRAAPRTAAQLYVRQSRADRIEAKARNERRLEPRLPAPGRAARREQQAGKLPAQEGTRRRAAGRGEERDVVGEQEEEVDPWEKADDAQLARLARQAGFRVGTQGEAPSLDAGAPLEQAGAVQAREEPAGEATAAAAAAERTPVGLYPPRGELHAVVHVPVLPGRQTIHRTPITIRTLAQAPHFPYSLSILGGILATVASHNERRCDPVFWQDSRAERATKEEKFWKDRAARRAARAAGVPCEPLRKPLDSIEHALTRPRAHAQASTTSTKQWNRIDSPFGFPCAAFGERYFLWRGDWPKRGEAGAVDDPDSHWTVFCADADSAQPTDAHGLIDARFYSSHEPWLLRESRGWEYDAAEGRLRDRGAAGPTNTPPEPDEPLRRGCEEEDRARCDPALGALWFPGQQALTRLLDELSRLDRPVRLNSIAQLWVPTVRKVAAYLRFRPRTLAVTYYRRFVLPPDAPLLHVDEAAEAARVEREWGMQFSKVMRKETSDLGEPLRQTARYLGVGLQFSSALRPHARSPNAASILYGAQTVNTDLSLAPPLILPQHARSGLHGALIARSARAVHRALTQTVDPGLSTEAARCLAALLDDALPLHAKIPVSDRATEAFLRASGWREVYGGIADVTLSDWYEVSDHEFESGRIERRMGMTKEEQDEFRRRQMRHKPTGHGEGGDGGPGGAGQSMHGVFSNPAKPDKWGI
ncbi:hypothetical protein CALCODRAFT_479634 [Calocera cornea HHB12733]|uniref:Uncharacterized protein n=1 Tax=Calocera cornea HHB12733 TaxID=1353952 RepID=A0A165JIG3_9BASI|nr:hypothetical protein CALCODRAFT_479634 [Calocera cornea HHB12733]